MNAPHEQLQGTLLPDGKVLLVGTLRCAPACYSDPPTKLYDPSTNSWIVTASPQYPRFNHISELLPNGKVLVAGGYISPSVLTTTAEIYDPPTQTWTPTSSLTTPHQFHHSARLKDGRILVVGGLGINEQGAFQVLSSAEIYNPTSGSWTAGGNMNTPRFGHAVITLPDGRVLVAGGSNSATGSEPALGTAEIYDPASNRWSSAANLNAAREGHRAVVLPNGEVMVAGGTGYGGCLASTELYDAGADRWAVTASMSAARQTFALNVLPDGRVLAAGGSGGNNCGDALDSAEI